jgi:hypothetical protein
MASSILPISGHSTLVYGSDDAGMTVHADDPNVNKLMGRVMKALNLKVKGIQKKNVDPCCSAKRFEEDEAM